MSYKQNNSRGVEYFLNAKEVTLRNGNTQTIYFFSKDYREDTAVDLPEDKMVVEVPANGFLVLKNKQ